MNSTDRASMLERSSRYEFRFAEPLSATAVAAFPELRVAPSSTGSVLYGHLRDRDELHAILDRIHLLGLTILAVHRLPA